MVTSINIDVINYNSVNAYSLQNIFITLKNNQYFAGDKMTRLVLLFFLVVAFLSKEACSQGVTFGGYVDAYYAYDSDKNGNSLRQFSSIAPYRDEFRLNTAQVSGKYSADKVRAVVTLHYGDIHNVNWPANMQFIQEANAGFTPAKNLWIDAGFFLTHIGAEGVLPKGNYLTSLSLPTYFEPFYQSGVKVSYDFSPKVYGCIHLLNGYNVFVDNNKNKSAGITFGVRPNDKSEIVYNNLIGNEQPAGSTPKLRIYNNLVLKYAITKKLDFIAGVDFAMQEKSKISDSTESASVYSGLAAFRFKPTKKFAVSVRGEIYNDENGMLSGVFTDSDGNPTGLKAFGITGGVEYRPVDNAFIRIEARFLSADSKQKIFFDNTNTRTEVLTNLGVEF
jgi:hypothetical protein